MIALPLLVSSGQAADLHVGPGQPFATLAEAMDSAASGDVLVVEAGTYRSGTLDVGSRSLAVEPAAGEVVVALDDGFESLFVVAPLGALTLTSVTFDGRSVGRLAEVDGGILVLSSTVVHDVVAPDDASGGAILATGSRVDIDGSTFLRGGAPDGTGGFIALVGSTLHVFATSFQAGSAEEGGAIHAMEVSTVAVEGSTFTQNTSEKGASAIDSDNGGVTVAVTTFLDNAGDRGAIQCKDGSSCITTASIFERNAGAMRVEGTLLTSLLDSVVCASGGAKHAVEWKTTTGTIAGTILHANEDSAIRVDKDAVVDIRNVHLTANASDHNGALHVHSEVELRNALVAGNTAEGPILVRHGGDDPVLDEDYTLFFANATSDSDLALGANDLVGLDPLIDLNAGCDDIEALRPPPGSPAVDAGDPTLLDPDGTRSDIGAFGGSDLPGSTGPTFDGDGDGFLHPSDCDDDDPAIHPGAPEIRDDGIDQDCSGEDTETVLNGIAGLDCGCHSPAVAPSWLWLPLLAGIAARRGPQGRLTRDREAE